MDWLRRIGIRILEGSPIEKLISIFEMGKIFLALKFTSDIPILDYKSSLYLTSSLERYICYIDCKAKELAIENIKFIIRHRDSLLNKQLHMFRVSWIISELFAMACSISRALHLAKIYDNKKSIELAEVYCYFAQKRIDSLLKEIRNNKDEIIDILGDQILNDYFKGFID